MHPNAYLRTFWQLELRPQIFVAMSFAEAYRTRYEQVIAPAIEDIRVDTTQLSPYRVDNSKSGDSILTDIMDGVAHSRMVVADLSTLGRDSKTGESYRNGNVMYEVGIALACRQPTDVLLIRDDDDKFLFDVSTVPHMRLDFVDVDRARELLRAELIARLREQTYVADARVRIAISSLSNQELKLLSELEATPPDQVRGWNVGGTVLSTVEAAVMRLLDKKLVMLGGQFTEGYPGYQLTQLGRVVAEHIRVGLPRVVPRQETSEPDTSV